MKRRCAIYTRKSTEEGLEQSFNSLDAQREACGAYVLSQVGEGWSLLKQAYEDGGYSGGSMDRPALRELLADIKAGKIDIIVVYKVDRLTRSLADFAKIVETLDSAGASFVSVTQAFNTTTSMGRLTLNVLLSFAQFEREVTSERIRDKFAASKAKGMWMGGNPSLGYDVKDRHLVVNEEEAATVRRIFECYLKERSVHALRNGLAASGIKSKGWITQNGVRRGGFTMDASGLNKLLKNRLYVGEIFFKGKIYQGQHRPILDRDLFDAVQAKLAAGAPLLPNTQRRGSTHALKGLLFDDAGFPMSPAHANKKGMRYLYYVSTAHKGRKGVDGGSLPRVSAPAIERAVFDILEPVLDANWMSHAEQKQRAFAPLTRVTIGIDRIAIDLDPGAIIGQSCDADNELIENGASLRIIRSIRLRNRGAAQVLTIDGTDASSVRVDRTLVRAVVQARHWAAMLEDGRIANIEALAEQQNLCVRRTTKVLPLAYLAPNLIEMILAGKQPASLTLAKLVDEKLPYLWQDQRAFFARFN